MNVRCTQCAQANKVFVKKRIRCKFIFFRFHGDEYFVETEKVVLMCKLFFGVVCICLQIFELGKDDKNR